MHIFKQRPVAAFLMVMGALMLVAACGSDDEGSDAASETTTSAPSDEDDTVQSTTTEPEALSPEDAVEAAEFIGVGLGNDDEALVYVSQDGRDWVETAEIGQIGAPYLAVGEDRVLAFSSGEGRPGQMWISEDSGLNWEQAPPLEINIVSVGYLDGAFFAMAAGTVYRSVDGTDWQPTHEFDGFSGNIFEGPPGLRAFPRTPFDFPTSMGSADGTTWAEEPLTLPDDATQSTMSIATYAHDGSQWWSVAKGALVFSSDDGKDWEAAGNLPVNFPGRGLAISDGTFVATLDNGLVYVSSDGVEWEKADNAPAIEDVEPTQP